MGWKATGQPTVRQQRDKWVVRVDGIDTVTGTHRPRRTIPIDADTMRVFSRRRAEQAAERLAADR